MATKPVKLICFDIIPAEEKITKTYDFLKDLKEALNTSKTVNNRRRNLSDIGEEGQLQFISRTSIDAMGVFCTFLHLKEGGAALVKTELLKKSSFSLGDIKETAGQNIAGHIIGHTCFLFANNKLILKSSRNITISEISIYLNWLLKKSISKFANRNIIIFLKPHLKKDFNPLNVGSIHIGKDVIIKEETIGTIIQPVLKDLISQIIQDKELEGLDPKNIIDASVVLTFRKPLKDNEKKNKRMLQSVLDAVKSDETMIRDRKGNLIREDLIKETKDIRVQYISSDFPDEHELEQKMREYIMEI